MTPSTSPTLVSPLRWWVCALLLLATTLNYMDRVALNQTINKIMAEFGLDDRQYSRLESAFAVAFGVGTLLAGWLVDRVNVRWVYPVVVFGWSVAGFLTGYATGFLSLLACRVALGLFEAGNWPCGIRTVRTVVRPEERSLGNSLFGSGTAIGAIITPQVVLLCYRIYGVEEPGVWAVPFRVIGLIGLTWVAAWFLTVPGRLLPPPEAATSAGEPFAAVFRDRRFWVLVAVIIGVNSSWHTFRIWLPRFLKVQHGYSEVDIQNFGTWYYLCADVGSWTVGLVALLLARRGFGLFRSRLATFVGCTVLLASGAAIPFLERGSLLTAVLLTFGFGALGLFPTYFALSQDLSARHQGKVTGTLGCINALYLAGMAAGQGWYVNETKRFDLILAVAGIPAAVACLVVAAFWKPPRDAETTSP